MSKRVIDVSLSPSGIDKAIRELKEYEKWLNEKTKEFLKALGEEGVQIATAKFGKAVYAGHNDVSVSMEDRGENAVAVVAVGNATLFIEFGTGIRYPEHPLAEDMGMVRGEYGYRLGGLEKGWRYQGVPGNVPDTEVITEGKHAGEVHTFGNPANMCMYFTVKELEAKIEEIARRVYA